MLQSPPHCRPHCRATFNRIARLNGADGLQRRTSERSSRQFRRKLVAPNGNHFQSHHEYDTSDWNQHVPDQRFPGTDEPFDSDSRNYAEHDANSRHEFARDAGHSRRSNADPRNRDTNSGNGYSGEHSHHDHSANNAGYNDARNHSQYDTGNNNSGHESRNDDDTRHFTSSWNHNSRNDSAGQSHCSRNCFPQWNNSTEHQRTDNWHSSATAVRKDLWKQTGAHFGGPKFLRPNISLLLQSCSKIPLK